MTVMQLINDKQMKKKMRAFVIRNSDFASTAYEKNDHCGVIPWASNTNKNKIENKKKTNYQTNVKRRSGKIKREKIEMSKKILSMGMQSLSQPLFSVHALKRIVKLTIFSLLLLRKKKQRNLFQSIIHGSGKNKRKNLNPIYRNAEKRTKTT